MNRRHATIGTVVGWWTLTSDPYAAGGRVWVDVQCRCGREHTVRLEDLPDPGDDTPRRGRSTRCRSCGSRHSNGNTLDLRSTHPLYATWTSMLNRCSPDPSGTAPNWRHYGGRGIRVCDDWADPVDGFWRFVEHMGPRPSPEHTVDRIDVDGHYQPGNVRWSDVATQLANRRAAAIAQGPF